jgi:DNA-binding SARP family transcriptional activator
MEKISKNLAKITRPLQKRVLTRERLFSLMGNARKFPVIWITGPPGCGKTTLISSYIQTRDIPCLWYQVDERDADPATWFYYMGLAAKKAVPRSRKALPILSSEYIPDLSVFALRFFEQIYAKLKDNSLMVFDNYHELPDNNFYHDIMQKALSCIPQNMNVVVVSRVSPPKNLIYLLANNSMKIIRWEDLKLTLEETRQIVKIRTDNVYPNESIHHMLQIADGWVSGLILMLEAAQPISDVVHMDEYRTPDEIFNYFAGEIFDQAGKEIQEFFLKTAILSKISINVAKKLTGISNAAGILSKLSNNNYFIFKYSHPKVSYQYHPLFREFLLSRFKKYFSKKDQSGLRQKAAELLEGTGEFEEAAMLYIEDNNYESLVSLIMAHTPELLEQGRNAIVLEWLEKLPEKMVNTMPWLIFWKAVSVLVTDPEHSRLGFEQAFNLFTSQEDTAGKLLSWSGAVNAIIMSFESFKTFDFWLEIFNEIKEDFESFPIPEIKYPVAASMCNIIILRHIQHPDIEKWASLGIVPGKDSMSLNNNALLLCHLHGYYLQYKLDFEKAKEILDKLHNIETKYPITPLSKVLIRYSEINYFEAKGRFQGSLEAVAKFRTFTKKTKINLFNGLISGHEVAVLLDINDQKSAKVKLEDMALFLDTMKPWEKWLYYLQKTRLALIGKDFVQADKNIVKSLETAEYIGNPIGHLISLLLKIYVLHGLGNTQETKKYFSIYFQLLQSIDSSKEEFMGLMAKAYIDLDSGREIAGIKALRQAFAVGKKHTLLNVFCDLPEVTTFLCVKALEHDIEIDYVQTIIKKRKLVPKSSPVLLANWPWPLKFFTLGRFELRKNDIPMRFSGKVQQKPLDMLKLLIAMGGANIHEDRISDVLWPDADGDNARKSFATTLHRLRKLLGEPKAIRLIDRRLTLSASFFWVDVWAFKELIRHVDAMDARNTKLDAVQKMIQAQKAVDLYKGEFLSGEEWTPHIISIRSSLEDLYLKVVLATGQYFEDLGQWEKALVCYQKGLDKNYLVEELYRKIIICYLSSGQHAQALSTYTRCKKILIEGHGMDLSYATKSVGKSIGGI